MDTPVNACSPAAGDGFLNPYQETKEVNEEARKAGADLIQKGKKDPKKRTFIFVNNRLEGNALQTIQAMLDIAEV